MPFIVVALLLAAAIGGGVSVIAQSALPGEPLWSFKTGVVERLQPGSDIAAIQMRLQEVSALAAQGKLTEAARAELTANIAAHAAAAQKQIADSGRKGDYAAAADLAARLQAALAGSPGTLDLRQMLDAASELSADASAKAK